MGLDRTVTCRRRWPACSRLAASLATSASAGELVRYGHVAWHASEGTPPYSGSTGDAETGCR